MRLRNTLETRIIFAVPLNILKTGFNDKGRARVFVLGLEAGRGYCVNMQIYFANLTFSLLKREQISTFPFLVPG
jgi:hypothetical protein